MQIYIVRTEVDYEVPVVLGYYETRVEALARLAELVLESRREPDTYPLNVNDIIIEEATLGQAITPDFM